MNFTLSPAVLATVLTTALVAPTLAVAAPDLPTLRAVPGGVVTLSLGPSSQPPLVRHAGVPVLVVGDPIGNWKSLDWPKLQVSLVVDGKSIVDQRGGLGAIDPELRNKAEMAFGWTSERHSPSEFVAAVVALFSFNMAHCPTTKLGAVLLSANKCLIYQHVN